MHYVRVRWIERATVADGGFDLFRLKDYSHVMMWTGLIAVPTASNMRDTIISIT